MMKGVSKQILEVTNTENPYFEKIIFFVKPEHAHTDYNKLKREAESVATVTRRPPKVRLTKRQILRTVVGSLIFTLAGCAITFLINYLV